MSDLVGKKMGRKPALTQRQMKFAELYVFNDGEFNQTECAVMAGYKNRPRQNASDLKNEKKYPLVAQYIAKLRKELRDQHSTDYDRHMNMMGKIRNISMKQHQTYAVASNTEYRRGQASDLYRNENINVNIDVSKKFQDMSKEELQEYMENKYVNNMKDVSPEPKPEESKEE